MGRFPFDRLLDAVAPLCADRRVLAQTGTSTVRPPCDHLPFVPADELARLLAEVPIVITHGGNTVRLVQNLGKVPIAVARRAEHGEMADDHQVAYLEHERTAGRVIIAEADAASVRDAVDRYATLAPALLQRPLPTAITGPELADRLDGIVRDLAAPGRRRRRAWSTS